MSDLDAATMLIISELDLRAALLQWELARRRGETLPMEVVDTMTAEQVADGSTARLWAALGAVNPPQLVLAAKPLEWEEHRNGREWHDKHCGFYISHEPDDEAEYQWRAAWGEDDAEPCASLDEAKAWCQAQIDDWVQGMAVLKAAA